MHRPSKEEIRALPLYVGLDMANISIVENEIDATQALDALNTQISLGFDTETKPIFRKGQVNPGPTLVQLSTQSHAYLFPLRFPAAVACVKKILANKSITKIGFGINGDIKELREKLNINMTNTQNLSVVLKNLVGERNQIGARAAVAMVLKQRLAKGAQQSNWGAYPLKEHQIRYAANDAHSAICIVKALDI